jgi:hypothetical protein
VSSLLVRVTFFYIILHFTVIYIAGIRWWGQEGHPWSAWSVGPDWSLPCWWYCITAVSVLHDVGVCCVLQGVAECGTLLQKGTCGLRVPWRKKGLLGLLGLLGLIGVFPAGEVVCVSCAVALPAFVFAVLFGGRLFSWVWYSYNLGRCCAARRGSLDCLVCWA